MYNDKSLETWIIGVGDSAVVTPTTSVGDSSVGTSSFIKSDLADLAVGTTSSTTAFGTPSFTVTPCSNVGLMGNV